MGLLQKWEEALKSGDSHLVTSLYSEDAVLLPTLDPRVLIGRPAIFPYFARLQGEKEGLHVQWHGSPLLIEDNVAAGLYRFVWDGGHLDARYTFVKYDGEIVHHHSSALP